eukprot:18517-Chlamydomonas_euryale.AAC.2
MSQHGVSTQRGRVQCKLRAQQQPRSLCLHGIAHLSGGSFHTEGHRFLPLFPTLFCCLVQGLMCRPDWEAACKVPFAHLPGGSGNGLAASCGLWDAPTAA